MKEISKVGSIITKIMEVFHWVGAAILAAATVCAKAAPNYVDRFVGFEAKECCGAELEIYGFEVNAPVINGNADMTCFLLFGIGGVIILALMAMIFRNLYHIFKGTSPFRKENIRLMREIGIFAIAVPVVGFLMSIVVRLVMGVEAAEVSVDMGGIFMGIIILSLTQFFIRGAELEEDAEGLL